MTRPEVWAIAFCTMSGPSNINTERMSLGLRHWLSRSPATELGSSPALARATNKLRRREESGALNGAIVARACTLRKRKNKSEESKDNEGKDGKETLGSRGSVF